MAISSSKFVYICAMILLSAFGVQAACQFWDGTAPFCNGGCGSGCRTLATSNCGNGACCWTGHKALCQCCPATNPVCTPTQTSTTCYGVVLVCKNEQVTLSFQGPVTTTCSTYVCGICFGFGSFFRRNNDNGTHCDDGSMDITNVDPMHRDVYVQGNVTLSEDEIENQHVQLFGPRLTPDQMKSVKVVRVTPPDVQVNTDQNTCDKSP